MLRHVPVQAVAQGVELECDDEGRAREALESLPLVRAGLMAYELTALHPYTGFARLGPGTG